MVRMEIMAGFLVLESWRTCRLTPGRGILADPPTLLSCA